MTDPMIVRRTLAVQLVHAVRTPCGVRGLSLAAHYCPFLIGTGAAWRLVYTGFSFQMILMFAVLFASMLCELSTKISIPCNAFRSIGGAS